MVVGAAVRELEKPRRARSCLEHPKARAARTSKKLLEDPIPLAVHIMRKATKRMGRSLNKCRPRLEQVGQCLVGGTDVVAHIAHSAFASGNKKAPGRQSRGAGTTNDGVLVTKITLAMKETSHNSGLIERCQLRVAGSFGTCYAARPLQLGAKIVSFIAISIGGGHYRRYVVNVRGA